MTFREEIAKELQGLSKKQIIEFAWRCGIRALPYLAIKKNFDYWKEKKQQYLYSVFNAFDIAAADAAYAAAYAAFAVADAAAKAAAKAADAAFAVVYAAADAADAAELIATISKDIESIKLNTPPTVDISIYGPHWNHFLESLRNIGCTYWADWYQQLFENNFQFDLTEVKQRVEIPNEIKEQGAAAVGQYMLELKKAPIEPIDQARIIILGDKGVGKTCLARKLVDINAEMTKDHESTLGVETSNWSLDNLMVNLWDFAGHAVTHAAHRFFLSERCFYIIVYDGRTDNTYRLNYWLQHVKDYGGDSQAIIFVNQRDENRIEVPVNSLNDDFNLHEKGYFIFNLEKDKYSLVEFRDFIADYITNNPSWEKKQIPRTYYQVKKELEKQFEEGKDFIAKEDFLAIAEEKKVLDSAVLLQSLHNLGISLWYKDLDELNTLVLNPDWICDGIYHIINWVNNQKKYKITLNGFKQVFKSLEKYPTEKHIFLYKLMLKYELAFESKKDQLIIPHLLKIDQPKSLPIFDEKSLALKYEADRQLPPNTISRFIVQRHEEIYQAKMWRTGVILKDEEGSIALVREVDRTIEVSVKGVSQTAFISSIRESLNAIFKTYKSKHPTISYKVWKIEKWLLEEDIVIHQKRGRDYEDLKTNQVVPISDVTAVYNITYNYFSADRIDNLLSGSNNQLIQNTFNFNHCNIELQGELQYLAESLFDEGAEKEAKKLERLLKLLKEVEDTEDKAIIKKKGLGRRIKNLVKDLGDKGSDLRKLVDGIDKSGEIIQNVLDWGQKALDWLGTIGGI